MCAQECGWCLVLWQQLHAPSAVMGASFLHPHQHGLFFSGLAVLVPGFLSALVPLTVTWLLQCAIIYVSVVVLLRFSCPLLFTSGLALVSLSPITVALGLEILGASLRAWRWGGLRWLQIESAGPSGLVCGDMASHLLIQEEEPAPALGSYLFFSPGRQRSGLTHSRFQISLLRFSSPMLWVILGQQWSHVCPLDTLRRQVSCWVAKEHFPSEWTTRAGPQDLTERLHLALA